MHITMRYGVYLRGDCFDPAQLEGRDVDAGEAISVTPFWAVQLVHSGRAIAGEPLPAAPALTTDAIVTADPVPVHRDPKPRERR